MERHMRLLPDGIIQNITSYTYNIQPHELRDDIKSYYNVSKLTKEMYEDRWEHCDNQTALDWLINDIIRFLNRDMPTMYGYQEYYKNIIKRHFKIRNKTDEEIFDILCDIDECSCQDDTNFFKISMGLLTPIERNQLMHFLKTFQLTLQE